MTGWEEVSDWYDQVVGCEGHHYHQKVIFPKLLPLLNLKKESSPSLLDLGCGQGVLAQHLPSFVRYCGIDLSPSLIASARKKGRPGQDFIVADLAHPLPLEKGSFTHACFVLSLQNMADGAKTLSEVAAALVKGGTLAIVLNHPCFRIPRQSRWGFDAEQKVQYRRIDRYLSPLEIPIQTHPGKGETTTTLSFHHSLSGYSRMLCDAGCFISLIEEWISDKISLGGRAKAENRARSEFPLFLTLIAKRIV